MSVATRRCSNGSWMVDIRYRLPDGTKMRERHRLQVTSKTAAQRWGEKRERYLMEHGPTVEVKAVPTFAEFAPRFLDGYVKANHQKPSGIAAQETILRVHLTPAFGALRLDAITTEGVQQLKHGLAPRAAKTINNVLTTLNTLLKTAVAWGVLAVMPCTVRLVHVATTEAPFHDFDEFDRLVAAARTTDALAYLLVLLGGEAGLRCGEMMALSWSDVDLAKKQLAVQRSEWKGHITTTKGGRVRYVPMTRRLTAALQAAQHTRSTRVLCLATGNALTQKVVRGLVMRAAHTAGPGILTGVHVLRHTFCSHLAMRGAPVTVIQAFAGHQDLDTTLRYMHLSPRALNDAILYLEPPKTEAHSGAPANSETAKVLQSQELEP